MLKGKTAIVTGSTSEIGIATAPAAAGLFVGGLTWLLADHRGSISLIGAGQSCSTTSTPLSPGVW